MRYFCDDVLYKLAFTLLYYIPYDDCSRLLVYLVDNVVDDGDNDITECC